MTKDPSAFEASDSPDNEKLRQHYEAIRETLIEQTESDIAHHLPNLVETIIDASHDPETVRFVGGVSFTRDSTPLDYYVSRLYQPDDVDFVRQEPLKLPVSRNHHYVAFVYPADLGFDAGNLRAILLTVVESTLHSIMDSDGDYQETKPTSRWGNP